MTTDYTQLSTFRLEPSVIVLNYVSLPKVVHLTDPATTAMMDFANNPPLTFDKTAPMMMARRAMEARSIPFVFVLNAEQQVTGFLSLKHILSEEPIKMIEEDRVMRSEVLISNVMTSLAEIPTIDSTKLELAKVGHILKTLEHAQSECILVVDHTAQHDKKSLRGIFLLSDLNKLLGK
jgi:hypothetical protein